MPKFLQNLVGGLRALICVAMLPLLGSAALAQSLTVSPGSVNFGSQPAGVAGNPWTLTLNNTGSTAVTVTSIGLTDSTDFFETTTCGATLGAYSNCNIAVGFKPASAGNYAGSLVVVNSATAQPIAVALNGTGTGSGTTSAPNPNFSPANISFGAQTVGTASNAWTATLNNTGTGELDITSLSVNDTADFTIANDCHGVVSAYSNCHVTVVFNPSTVGAITGTLTLVSNAAVQTIALNGTGTAAAASVVVAPATVSFGNQNEGSASNSQTVTVSNTSASAVSLSSLAFSPAGDFSVSSTTCGGTLAAHTTCNISVVFTPTVAGSESSQLVFSAGGVSQSVPVSGTGVAVTTPVATLLLSPSQVDFGTVNVGASAPTWTISVNNTSSVAAQLAQAMGLSGSTAFTITSNNCGNVIAAHASCTVTVAFAPTAAGNYSGVLSALVTGATTAQTVSLSGNATSTTPSVIVSPSAVDFGSVTTGQTANSWTLTVNNPAGAAITFSSPVSLAGSREFEMTTTCGAGLAAYSQCQVLVSFFPVIPGVMHGQVVVNVAGGSTQTVSLTGNGVGAALTPTVTLTPSVFDFGSVVTGKSSVDEVFTLNNAGATDAYFAASASLTGSASFLIDGNTCANPIPAGTSCTISVKFSPTTVGSATGELVVPFDGITNALMSGLNGTGTPSVTGKIAPASYDFGTTIIGQSGDYSFSVVNTGDSTATFTSFVLSGAGFSMTTNGCGATLAGHTLCKIGVHFAPTTVGAVTGTLSVSVVGLSTPWTASLAGDGEKPVQLVLSGSSLNLGSESIGDIGAAQTFTMTNPSATLDVPYSLTSSVGFHFNDPCAGTVPAGTQCVVSVQFNPQVLGLVSGSLTIAEYSGLINLSESLYGTGVGFNFDPAVPNFGNQGVGVPSAVKGINMTPAAAGFPQVDHIAVIGDFAVSSDCTPALQNGASCTEGLVFNPTVAGVRSGAMIVTFATGATQTLALTGTGVSANTSVLVSNVSSLNFGDVANYGYGYQQILLTNTGFTPAEFSINSSDWDFFAEPSCNGSLTGAGSYSLYPGQTCSVTVYFEPIGYGTDQGLLTFALVNGTSTTVKMTGQYTAQQPTFDWSSSNGALAFATTYVGATSAPQTFTLTNKSNVGQNVDMGIYSPAQSTAYQIVGGTCSQGNNNYYYYYGTYVAPGGSCTVTVVFTPQQPGTSQQQFYIYNQSSGSYTNVSLLGNGTYNANNAPSYTLSVAPGMMTLSAGSTGTATFTMTPQVGFKGTITLACDHLPAGVSCSFVPPTLTSDGSGRQLSSVLTVSTTGISGMSGSSKMASMLALPALVLFGMCFTKRRKIGMVTLGALVLMTAMVSGTTGCGAGFSPNLTPVGQSVIHVTATASGTTDTKVASFKLVITQ